MARDQTPRKRLTKQDWVDAGLAALGRGGPDAVAVEPLAVALGATKGSGYWHWESREALLAAVVERWLDVATHDVVTRLEAGGGDPVARLDRLLGAVVASATDRPGEALTLAHQHPVVRSAVARASQVRVGYVARLLTEAGLPADEARRRAVLAYAAYVGYAQLAATAPDLVDAAPGPRKALQRSLVRMVTQPVDG